MTLVEAFLVISAATLLGFATVGTAVYFNAVRHGYRAYKHVTIAFVFVFAVSITGTVGLLNDPVWVQALRTVFNFIGIWAMTDLIGRFRHPSVGGAKRTACQDEELEELREFVEDARVKARKRVE